MCMMPLHLHVTQKSDYDDDDVRLTPCLERTEVKNTDGFGYCYLLTMASIVCHPSFANMLHIF